MRLVRDLMDFLRVDIDVLLLCYVAKLGCLAVMIGCGEANPAVGNYLSTTSWPPRRRAP